jgi:hypothetical protein
MTYRFKLSRRLAISLPRGLTTSNLHQMMLCSLLILCACTGSDINEPSTIELARGGIKGPPERSGDELVGLSIDPTAVTLQPSEQRTFRAKALRKNGDTLMVAARWTATGGKITSLGEYLAGSLPGHFRVIARSLDNTLADTSDVVISSNDSLALSAIVLTPEQVSLSTGATQQFAAAGLMSDGTSILPTVTYSATGGTITNTGLYTAGETAGTFQVVASDSGGVLADTAVVEVTADPAPPAPSLAQVVLKPSSASLTAGQTKQFSAYGVMSNGDSVAVSASYSATGGTISSSGLFTAGTAAGTFRAIATAEGKADTASITISSPPATSPPSVAEGCPTSGYLRLVNVSTAAQLSGALSAALPGDQIRLASGNYAGGFSTSRDGTQSNPITLCGPRTATIQNTGGWFAVKSDWWIFRGFRLISGVVGLYADNANHLVIDSLLVENVNQEGIMLQGTAGSSYNIVRNNTIRYTGRVQSVYGEGIYVGSGQTNNHPSNFNQIIDNHFGPGVTAEHIELKVGTSGNLVKGNVSDATGSQFISGAVGGVYTIAGANQTVEDNSIFNVNAAGLSAFWAFRVNGAVFRRNSAAGPLMSWGFRVSDATNVVVYCDNTGTKNVACTP